MLENQEICYKHGWVLSEIRKAINKIESRVTNTEIVEHRAVNRVGRYLMEDKDRIKNRRYLRRLIHQETQLALKQFRKEQAVHFSSMSYNDSDEDSQEYEPVDPLARVGSDKLELKETIALLAQNDRRNEMILNAWADGETNDTEISRGLASVLGGKATGHLSHIKKFKIDCRTELTAQAI